MSNLQLRILLIVVALPILFAAVFFLPYFNYLAICLVAAFFSITGTYETWKIFGGEYTKKDFALITAIAFSIPVIVYLECAGILPYNIVYYWVGFLIFIIFIYQVFNRDENSYNVINKKTSAMLVLIFYPGIFFSYSIRFSTLHHTSYALFAFMALVFFNDICAYIAGMLWGAKSRGVIPISPKKSLIGFIVGFLASIFAASILYLIMPVFFASQYWYAFATGAIIGIVSIVGDLSESAMKRSANLKDSGNVLPGRGGILDNIDSLIFSAPAYYFIINYISTHG